jgi:hypothetical protein
VADTWAQQNDLNAAAVGTGALTLAQAALLEKDVLKQGVLEIFTAENPVLQRLPFMDIAGNSLMYDYEVALPAVGFRSVNEGYDTSHGRAAQRSVGLAIFGGDLDVDKFIIQTRSSVNDQRALQEAQQVKAMSYQWLKYFFDGDRSTSGNEEFDGVNLLLADTYHTPGGAAAPWDMDVIAGAATGYAATAILDYIDEALDAVIGPNSNKVILANKTTHRWLTKQARANAQIDISVDQWGYQVERYAGVPIIDIETDASGAEILAFDENCGGNVDTASFYVARFEPNYIQGLQNGGMAVRDMGELQSAPVMRTRVEWFCALALMHPRAIKRVRGLDATYA